MCTFAAREWITGAAMYWVIEAILEQYGTDPEITNVVDSVSATTHHTVFVT
jgi:hypothetical protein